LIACGDDDSDDNCCDTAGWICVSILDQHAQSMRCDYNYSFPADTEGYEGREHNGQCEPNELMILGEPGTYRVNAECGKLDGYVEVPLETGDNGRHTSRLIGSLCYDHEEEIILDSQFTYADLGEWLGYSTDDRCESWFANRDRGIYEIRDTEISKVELACNEEMIDCEVSDGRQYLWYTDYGIHTGGWPMHLTVVDQGMVPIAQEVTTFVTVRQRKDPYQELDLPVSIRGPEEDSALAE